MATPSITMIPSGYKSQKVYSVLPTNGDGDLTFDRNNIGTRVNKNGLIEQVATDVPRLDYSDGSCPSLLLEPASTNLVIGSAEGNYGNAPASSTNTISPDGTNNAFIPVPNEEADRYQETIPAGTYLNGQKLTYSWYRKRISTPNGISRTGDLDIKGLENLTELETSNATQIESNVNGFDRFQAVVEIIDGSLESIFRAYFGGVVGVGNSSVAYFGHQLEEKPFATSYIPTTDSPESRGADSAIKDGLSSYISSTAGVLYAEFAALSNGLDGIFNVLTLNVGTASGANGILLGFNTTNQIYSSVGGQFISSYTPTDATDFHKVAVKYEDNNTKLFVNGNQIGSTNTTTTIPSGLSRLGFDSGLGGSRFHVKTKDVRVYNTALTDLELQELTTI
jgi:hypothetical protein